MKPCYGCGVVVDPKAVPDYDATTGRPGKWCPVCHVPLDAKAADHAAVLEGEEPGRKAIRATRMATILEWNGGDGGTSEALAPANEGGAVPEGAEEADA